MKYDIISTQPEDLNEIISYFYAAIEYQKKNNFPVWPDFDKGLLKQDILDRVQYKIMIHNEIGCVFTICDSDPIIWREKNDDNAIYLHRIVVNPKHKGNRFFGYVKDWAIDYARTNHIPHIRFDTWADNPTIIDYYRDFGFKIVDYYTTPDTEDLPIQQRGNDVVLFEIKLD